MAKIPATYGELYRGFELKFYNPAKRFITADDEVKMLERAALQVSKDIGGIAVREDVTTVANQASYPVNNQHERLVGAQLLKTVDGAQQVYRLEVVDEERASLDDLRASQRYPASLEDQSFGTESVEVPLYIKYDRVAATVTLYGAPDTADMTVRCTFNSLANTFDGQAATVYAGDCTEFEAILAYALMLCRQRLREMTEANYWRGEYAREIAELKKAKARRNQVASIQDGRFAVDALRSRNRSY